MGGGIRELRPATTVRRLIAAVVARCTGAPRLLALLLTLLALTPPAAAAAADDLAAHPQSLERVPDRFRPLFRWWWPSDEVEPAELRTELRAMRRAGFSGAEQILLANIREWGTPTFRERLLTSVRQADALGQRFDVTLGPGWPMSSPVTEDLSRELSSQDLHYGAVDLSGPTTFSGPVPDRPPADGVRKRLVAATAIRVVGGGSPQVLDPGSAVDLTTRVSDGTLTWAVPAGRWKLFGFWMRPSLMRAKAPGGGPPGWLVVDHFSRGAIDAVLGDYGRRVFTGDLARLLRRNGADVFEDSLEVEHGPVAEGQSAVFWTRTMPGEFARRRGYALPRLLPGVFEEFTFRDGLGERLKQDFDRTLNDLLIDNHLRPITRWANRKGLRSRAQAYYAGAGELGKTENSRLAAAVQKPDVETLGFGDPNLGETLPVRPGSADGRAVLDRYRQVVSGAHLSGAKEITSEWGAVIGGQFGVRLEDLKALADRSLAAGVSRMALHSFAYRPYDEAPGSVRLAPNWPGWCAYCGRAVESSDSWNQHWPLLEALRGLADYVARAGAAVRGGRPRVDLTLLNATSVVSGIGAPRTSPRSPEDRLRSALHGAGYSWDVIDPVSLPGAGGVSGGRLLARGPAYKALVVNDLDAIPVAAARRLLQLGGDGLPIVLYGRLPRRGTSVKGARQEDTAVRAEFGRLRALAHVREATTPDGLVRALRALEVRPDLEQRGPARVVPLHRRTATGDVWFLYNDSTRRVTTRLRFATRGAPTQIDLWTGRATRLGHYTEDAGRVTVPVSIDAAGTAVIAFDRRRAGRRSVTSTTADDARVDGSRIVLRHFDGGRWSAVLDDGRRVSAALPALPDPRAVTGPWRLVATTVQPSGDVRVERTLSELADWRDIPELTAKSGTGVYTATVDLPARWVQRGRGVLLDPGVFAGGLRVRVNGRLAGGAPIPGEAPPDVSRLLRAGRNTLRLEIATTLNNAVRAQGLLGDPDYASYVSRPVQAAGLTGPVRLIPYAEAPVWPPQQAAG